jgi:hypothetical protein
LDTLRLSAGFTGVVVEFTAEELDERLDAHFREIHDGR